MKYGSKIVAKTSEKLAEQSKRMKANGGGALNVFCVFFIIARSSSTALGFEEVADFVVGDVDLPEGAADLPEGVVDLPEGAADLPEGVVGFRHCNQSKRPCCSPA